MLDDRRPPADKIPLRLLVDKRHSKHTRKPEEKSFCQESDENAMSDSKMALESKTKRHEVLRSNLLSLVVFIAAVAYMIRWSVAPERTGLSRSQLEGKLIQDWGVF